MALNTSRKDAITLRRENVARLRLKGLTQREIAKALTLAAPPIVNDKGEAYNVATINSDLKALRKEWAARAAEAIDERKARQLAEIDEARRRCWQDGDMAGLARFIKLESDIFGTNAPVKQEHSGTIELVDAKAKLLGRFAATDAEGAADGVPGSAAE